MQKLTLLYLTNLCLILTYSITHAHINTPTGEEETAAKSFTQIPFELIHKLIIVEATVDGQTGKFILDSGASDLYLNEKYFKAHYQPEEKTFAGGIHGKNPSIGIYISKRFQWGRLKLKKIRSYTNNLQHIENVLQQKIMGLIGYPILKKYELLIDYNKRTLGIFQLDKKGNCLYKRASKKPTHILPFKMSRHFPVVEGEIAGRKVWLGLDTGASIGFLDQKLLKHFGEEVKLKANGNVSGVNGTRKSVTRGSVNQININFLQLKDMEVAFSNMEHFKQEYRSFIDGLMGYAFFSNAPIAINYLKKQLFIW